MTKHEKEQLGCEAIELAGEKIINNLKDVLSTHENIVEGLIANINEIAEIIDDEKKTRDMTISLIALETYSSSEALRKKCEKVFIELEKIYYDAFIDIGMKSEEAGYKSSVIQSMMEGAITTSLVKKNGSSLRNIAKIIPEIIKL